MYVFIFIFAFEIGLFSQSSNQNDVNQKKQVSESIDFTQLTNYNKVKEKLVEYYLDFDLNLFFSRTDGENRLIFNDSIIINNFLDILYNRLMKSKEAIIVDPLFEFYDEKTTYQYYVSLRINGNNVKPIIYQEKIPALSF